MGDNTLKEVLDSIDLESYLDREGIDYKNTRGSSGAQLNLKECPVCGGSKWKVFLNTETGLGNCFHGDCEKKFNKYSFISAHLGSPDSKKVREHLRFVAREMGWRAPRKTSVAVEMNDELILPESFSFPIKGKSNLRYLANRGISAEVARYFNLRYCSRGSFKYHIGEKLCEQGYDHRIIIPIFDLDGKMVSFQGRDITEEAEKKYLFPPGFASTGKYIYNGHNAVGAKRIVINEGAFDVIAAKIALDEDMQLRDVVAVGSFGKHLSNGSMDGGDQLAQLIALKQDGLEEVTFMWDGEPLAVEAACRASIEVSKIGLRVRIAILPAGKDPNEVPSSVVRDAYYGAVFASRGNLVRLLMNIKLGKLLK